MREVVYLSDSKLQQFMPESRRLPLTGKFKLTIPVGGLEVEPPSPDPERNRRRHMRKISEYIERYAKWYGDPGLQPGQWMQFETRLRYVTPRGRYRDLLLFVDSEHGRELACRLLMHGSVRHLSAGRPIPINGPELEDARVGGAGGGSDPERFLTVAREAARELALRKDPLSDSALDVSPRSSRAGVRALLQVLDAEAGDIDTASAMIGYARVTAILPAEDNAPCCVVASPLIVEYSPAQ